MKKLFFLLSMAFAGMQNVNAQTSEIYGSYSVVTLTSNASMNGSVKVSEDGSGLSLGCNHLSPFINDNFYLVVGGKLSYMWSKDDGYTENIFRLKVPASIKLRVYNHANDKNAIEPYAGINASMYMIHSLSNGSVSHDMFSDYDLNHFTLGYHVGVDFLINNFVFGVCYEKDFTNYWPDLSSKWSSVDFKVGYRFE